MSANDDQSGLIVTFKICHCAPGAGIKAQVCSVVELLVTTLFQAYAVFYMPPEGGPRAGEGALSCGMLFSTLENVTSTTPAGKQPGSDGSLETLFFLLSGLYLKRGASKLKFVFVHVV